MTRITVTTQDELDAAIRDHGAEDSTEIFVDSDPGVRLSISKSTDGADLVVGSASVVEVGGSARVGRVGDSARVDWVGDSARVGRVGDSARVGRVGGSARVDWVGDSARVGRVGDSASVDRAYGTSTLHLYQGATVEHTGTYVTVYLHHQRVTVSGGHLIDMTAIDEHDPRTWADLHGAVVEDDTITLYKAVDQQLTAGRWHIPTVYPVGEDVAATDWRPDQECGHGLHLSASPIEARQYHQGDGEPRFLEVTATLADIVTLDDKVKVRTLHVVREVDLYGQPVAGTVAA